MINLEDGWIFPELTLKVLHSKATGAPMYHGVTYPSCDVKIHNEGNTVDEAR
jgi:hypothetical protein